MKVPDFYLDKIFKSQQMGQMGIMLKKWHLSDKNELRLKCNDLSFNWRSQVSYWLTILCMNFFMHTVYVLAFSLICTSQ